MIRLSRPRFWLYVLGPYLVGLVAGADRLTDLGSLSLFAFGLYFLFPANLLIYGVNDIYDYESDRRNPKKAGYETLTAPREHRPLWTAILLANLPWLILVPMIAPRGAIGAMGAFLFFSVFYSAPPIRAKVRPVVDSAFNVLYVFPGVFAYFLVGGSAFSPLIFIAAWFWTMAMHAYSAVPDIAADRESGMETVATLFGFQGTLVFCLFLYAGAAALAFTHLPGIAVFLGIVYVSLIAYSLTRKSSEELLRVYRWFPLINTVSGALLFFGVALARFGLSGLLLELR